MRTALATVVLLTVTVTACGGEVTTTSPPTATSAGGSTTENAPTPTTTMPLVAGCPTEGEFTEGGEINRIEQSSSDASTIGLISWEAEEGCETFSITFETAEGAPATTPPEVFAHYLDGAPIVRIELDAERTVITDQLVETPMVDRLFVVRSFDGNLYIDLHLASPAQTRISVESSPARLVVDLQPGIVEYPTGVAIGDGVVVVSPLDESTQSTVFTVTGYARTIEANVLLIATASGEVIDQTFTGSADYLETWGEFAADLVIPPGEVSLFVGEESPVDRTLQGVTITLTTQ